MVNRVQYVKGHQFTFKDDSVSKVLENLQDPPKGLPFWMSRVLTRQLKGVLNLIEKELLKDVLSEFNKIVTQRDTSNWLLCLSVALLLCMCVEETQINTDALVRYQVSQQDGDPALIYETGIEICGNLETYAEHSWIFLNKKLIHLIKEKNPFKYGLPLGDDLGTESAARFVDELHQIIVEHGNRCAEHLEDFTY
jgi:hypothetical protein